jgi:rod shape determining protein RodA
MSKIIGEFFDIRTFVITIALVAIGLISIYSATYDARASAIFFKQLTWAGVGALVLFLTLLLPFRLLQAISFPAYGITIAMLVAVLVVGRTVSGSTSWFNLGALRLQPSEFAKITTVLALASFLSRPNVSLANIKDFGVAAMIVLTPLVLIMLQPDTGTAIIFLGLLFPILFWGGATRFVLLALMAPGVVALAALVGTTPFLISIVVIGALLLLLSKENRLAVAIVFAVTTLVGLSVQVIYDRLKPYQQKRIATFLDPNADPLGAGYNILQSKVAIGSGGLFGKGYLQGSQTQLNFIPEQWTDFIFCVPGEEFGFLGATLVLALFALFLARCVSIASTVNSRFASFTAIGFFGIIGVHAIINIGMALGLLPVIGVPLPFLSYGGSALLASLAMAGILMNLYANRKAH